MKTIVITGPSGSGKTYLSNKLYKLFDNSILIKTDSYYRDNILIRILSIFLYDIYDKSFSIKKNKINNTLRSLYNKDKFISIYEYDFKRKRSSESKVEINYKEENQFLILEGIFAHRLDINYKESLNIVCEEEKEVCFNRRQKRDQIERGRNIKEVIKKFNKSWYLYYQNIQRFLNINNVIVINQLNLKSYKKLIMHLQNLKKNQEK